MYCDLWSQYIQVQKLFKGGNYSRAETIRGNTVSWIFLNARDSGAAHEVSTQILILISDFIIFWLHSVVGRQWHKAVHCEAFSKAVSPFRKSPCALKVLSCRMGHVTHMNKNDKSLQKLMTFWSKSSFEVKKSFFHGHFKFKIITHFVKSRVAKRGKTSKIVVLPGFWATTAMM